MGTAIRPELSRKNKWWIERHRYYELKHFCLQYPIWNKALAALDGFSKKSSDLITLSRNSDVFDPTAYCVEDREFYSERMKMLEDVAEKTDPALGRYILLGVTEGVSYDILSVRLTVPCCKDTYYDLYRRFFWLLDKARG